MARSDAPPDVTGWPLRDAERILSEAAVGWRLSWTAWTGRPAETSGPRPEGEAWVLAQRPHASGDVLLVVARFAYDARGRGAALAGRGGGARGSTAREGG